MVDSKHSVGSAYRCFFPVIREKCRRMLGDHGEAEDVAQETFVRLWRERELIETDPRTVAAWIYRTATRLSIDRLRARRRHAQAAPTPDTDRRDPEALLLARRALGELVHRIPPAELEIAVLSRIDALRQQEIAEVVGASERSVRRALRRFDERLAALTEELS